MANGPATWEALSAVAERVTRLEERLAAVTAHSQSRSNRTWFLIMGVATGVVCPVIVTTVIAWLHLRSLG